jgi:hypothetical protein
MATQSPAPSIAEQAAQRASYSPDINRRIIALATALPEAQAREFLALLFVVVNDTDASMFEACHQDWKQVLAHLPGLATALELVMQHVRGTFRDCPCCPIGEQRQWPPARATR